MVLLNANNRGFSLAYPKLTALQKRVHGWVQEWFGWRCLLVTGLSLSLPAWLLAQPMPARAHPEWLTWGFKFTSYYFPHHIRFDRHVRLVPRMP